MKPEHDMDPADSGTMQTLQSHIEDMRSLTNCKICLNPFYEPYILACGHTYCYSCLRNWFGGQRDGGDRRSNRNCPDCRATVHVQPAPNYALRDLTHMFVQRAELIAEDETVKHHIRNMNTEAALLAADRDGSGLFQGMFKPQVRPFPPWIPIHDHEDNVSRCPICTWEMEDGLCSGCGFDMENPQDISDLSDDTEDDDDDDDDDESDGDSDSSIPIPPPYRPVEPFRRFHIPQIDSDDTDDESELDHSDIDRYDEHDDFIDNENEDDVDDMDGVNGTLGFRSDVSSQYSDGTVSHGEVLDPTGPHPHSSCTITLESMNTQDSDEVETNYDESDEDDQSVRAGSTRPSSLIRRRPVVISDDEEEEEVSHNAHEASTDRDDSESSSASSSDNSDDVGEESDDTAIPPQSGRSRQERLESHRARRPDKTISRAGRASVDIPSRPQSNRAIYSGPLRGNGRRSGASSRSTYVY